MDEVTIGAIVLVAIGAVITYLVTQHGRRIERFIKGDPGVRATIEVDAPGERGPLRIETDPSSSRPGCRTGRDTGTYFPIAPIPRRSHRDQCAASGRIGRERIGRSTPIPPRSR
jgi:hypothetical protein